MRKIWLVIKREYLVRIRSKVFIFTTVGLPLLSAATLIIPMMLVTRESDHTLKIALLDDAGFSKSIAAGFTQKLKNGQPLFQLVRTIEQPQSDQQAREELAGQVRRGVLDCYLVVPKGVLEGKAVEFHTQNPGDFQTAEAIHSAVDHAVISQRLSNRGIQIENWSELVRSAAFSLVKIGKRGESEEQGQTFVVVFILVMILYITLAVYGQVTMRSVLEEKTTRVVEILVSSARASQLLTGKILGVAGVGFTQFFIWTITAVLISAYGGAIASAVRPGVSLPQFHIPISLLIYALLFFLAGYFLYASLYAAVAATVSSDEELQQAQMPITLLIVFALLLYPIILRDPASRAAFIVSEIPFLSPILMVFRIGLQTPPFWQIALALALSVAATVGLVFVSAKIYRVGILMYGKRPSLVELLKWLKYT